MANKKLALTCRRVSSSGSEMMDLSVLIPARNEVYLQNTIDAVLAAIEADTEIIVVLDGYWPNEPIPDHPRVNIIHHSEPRGQRQSINEAARMAKGRHIMKLDAHCNVGQGFDRILIKHHQPEWTQVPRMYNLDVETWQPRHLDDFGQAMKYRKVHDYMYIGWNEAGEFRTLYYPDRENREWHARPQQIDETMSCMGCCFFMTKERFWELGGCDEDHGSWGQQGVEVALKAWLSGGALIVNKQTWFAHWFRASDGGFPYQIKGRDVDYARKYSRDLWVNNKWPQQVRTLEWLVEKFDPPGWGNVLVDNKQDELNKYFYRYLHVQRREPTWRGVKVVKMPTDLILYQQIIWQTKPKWIVEAGTKFGGSALFFQDMLDMIGEGGQVITIDKYPVDKVKDARIIYIEDSSINDAVVAQIREMVGRDPVMVVLDSNHSRVHVKWELHKYAPLVTSGQYMVVEDCYDRNANKAGPGEAVDWFLSVNKDFVQTNADRQYLIGFCRGGFLRKR